MSLPPIPAKCISYDVELRTDAGARLVPAYGDSLMHPYTVAPVFTVQQLAMQVPRDSSFSVAVFAHNYLHRSKRSNVLAGRATDQDSTMSYRVPQRWWGGKGTGTDWVEQPFYDDTVRYARGIYTASLSQADSNGVWMETQQEAQARAMPMVCHWPQSWRSAVACP